MLYIMGNMKRHAFKALQVGRDAEEALRPLAAQVNAGYVGSRRQYEQWRTLAFMFCDYFLGDKDKAATAARDAVAAFLLDCRETAGGQVPLTLLKYALGIVLQQSSDRTMPAKANALELAVPRLPAAERAVFILRGILNLSAFEVAVIGGTTSDEVHRLWTDSLLHLRALWIQKPF